MEMSGPVEQVDSISDTHEILAAVLSILMVACLFGYEFMSARHLVRAEHMLGSLSLEEREAMQWIATHTAVDSSFLVVTKYGFWEDRTSEWFPVLAHRLSLATVQGYEWIPNAFFQRWNRFDALQECATQDVSCLERWANQSGVSFTHVYLRKCLGKLDFFKYEIEQCCGWLQRSLESSADYELVYDGAGAAVFSHTVH